MGCQFPLEKCILRKFYILETNLNANPKIKCFYEPLKHSREARKFDRL